MNRSLLLALLTYGLILTGLATLRGELVALALPLAAYLLAGLLDAPGELRLEAQRSLDVERVPPGAVVEMRLRLVNRGARLEELAVQDELPAGLEVIEGSASHLLRLKPGQAVEWTCRLRGPRGYYAFQRLQARAADPFGLVQREATLSAPGQLFVLPSVLRLRRVAIRPRQTRVYSGTIPARVGGTGVEFFGVRAYQAGDSPHWINWHASARDEEALYSNEFEQERVADVGIVLDGRQRSNLIRRDLSLFEYGVMAAAALADAFLAQGNRVSLLLYGAYLHWTLPGYGKVQRERILQALARAECGESEAFADLTNMPTRLFPPRSQLVLVSPLLPEDLPILIRLRARDYQVMLVSPDPVAFELMHLPQTGQIALAARVLRLEREVMLQRLKRAGMQLLNWDVRQPLDQAVQAALGRPPAWLRAVGREL